MEVLIIIDIRNVCDLQIKMREYFFIYTYDYDYK